MVKAATYEFRNPPLYYALLGTLSGLRHPVASVYLMRLVSALINAALITAALAAAFQLSRGLLPVLGILTAMTPMFYFLAGSVNPNGVEIAAAICLWASLLVLFHGPIEPDGRLVARAGLAFLMLVLSRGPGLAFAWAILILIACASYGLTGLWEV